MESRTERRRIVWLVAAGLLAVGLITAACTGPGTHLASETYFHLQEFAIHERQSQAYLLLTEAGKQAITATGGISLLDIAKHTLGAADVAGCAQALAELNYPNLVPRIPPDTPGAPEATDYVFRLLTSGIQLPAVDNALGIDPHACDPRAWWQNVWLWTGIIAAAGIGGIMQITQFLRKNSPEDPSPDPSEDFWPSEQSETGSASYAPTVDIDTAVPSRTSPSARTHGLIARSVGERLVDMGHLSRAEAAQAVYAATRAATEISQAAGKYPMPVNFRPAIDDQGRVTGIEVSVNPYHNVPNAVAAKIVAARATTLPFHQAAHVRGAWEAFVAHGGDYQEMIAQMGNDFIRSMSALIGRGNG